MQLKKQWNHRWDFNPGHLWASRKETAAFETKRSAEVLWHPKLLGHFSFAEDNKISNTCCNQLQLAAVRGRVWSFYPCRFPSPLRNSFPGEARATFDLKKKKRKSVSHLTGQWKWPERNKQAKEHTFEWSVLGASYRIDTIYKVVEGALSGPAAKRNETAPFLWPSSTPNAVQLRWLR